jgi:hypothetical protein
VGAGSVVTADVAPYNVVGGVPARLIRDRFPAAVVARLLDSRWWTWPAETLSTNANLFQHPLDNDTLDHIEAVAYEDYG